MASDPISVTNLIKELALGGGVLTYDKTGTTLRDCFLWSLDGADLTRKVQGLSAQANDGVIGATEINLLSIPTRILDIAGCDGEIGLEDVKNNAEEMVFYYTESLDEAALHPSEKAALAHYRSILAQLKTVK